MLFVNFFGLSAGTETDYGIACPSEYITVSMTRVLFSLPSPLGVADGVRGVDHAVGELRRGGYVVLFPEREEKDSCVVLAAEAVTPQSLDVLTRLASGRPPVLVLTLRRAVASGVIDAAAVNRGPASVVQMAAGLDAGRMLALAQPGSERSVEEARGATLASAQGVFGAAVRLAKLARLLPAAVVGAVSGEGSADPVMMGRVRVSVADVLGYDMRIVRALRSVSEARVPLEGAEEARLIAFRPGDGGIEHLAIIVGAPKAETPVLVRLHSECFTGDLLGSLRCDCGNQLRGAIAAMAEAGAGVLLYLAQEGRGIGLVNKLRAYQLQDGGFDTMDANGQLGFDDDERVYLPAVEMLRQLGFLRVRLMTNNPRKVEALARHGITVVERIPHAFPANRHNLPYLRTKAAKGGHLF